MSDPCINAKDDSDTQDTSYSGAWSVSNCKCAMYGTTHWSTQRTPVFCRVAGGFGLVTSKAPNRGSAAVYVDGKKTATTNTYAKTAISSTFVYSAALSGTATNTVSVMNLATTGHPRILIDAIGSHHNDWN